MVERFLEIVNGPVQLFLGIGGDILNAVDLQFSEASFAKSLAEGFIKVLPGVPKIPQCCAPNLLIVRVHPPQPVA